MAHIQSTRNKMGAEDPGQGLREIDEDEKAERSTERAGDALHEGREKAGEGADGAARAAKRGGENVSDAVNNAGENLKGASGQAKDSLSDTANKAGDKAKEVAGNVEDSADATGDNIKERAGEATGAAEAFGERAREGTQRAAGQTSSAAKDAKNSAQDSAPNGTDNSNEGVKNATDPASSTAEDPKNSVESSADKAADRTSAVAKDAKDSAEESAGNLGHEAKQVAGETEKTAKAVVDDTRSSASDEVDMNLKKDNKAVGHDQEVIQSDPSKDSDSDSQNQEVGTLDEQIERIKAADTGPSSPNTDGGYSGSSEGGGKTKDEIPIQSTTVGQEMEEDTNKMFTNVGSQPVYRADDSTKSSDSDRKQDSKVTGRDFDLNGSKFGSGNEKETGFGVAGKDADLKVNDRSGSKQDYPEEYGAADAEFVARTAYKEDHQKDDDPGTLVALKNKLAGITD